MGHAEGKRSFFENGNFRGFRGVGIFLNDPLSSGGFLRGETRAFGGEGRGFWPWAK